MEIILGEKNIEKKSSKDLLIVIVKYFNYKAPEKFDPKQLKSYDKYDTKIHQTNLDKDMFKQKEKLESIYKLNDIEYKTVI